MRHALVLMLLALGVSGCNTVEGLANDVAAGSRAVKRAF
ncbi:MAG: entericidin, EcnA/B family [Silicimonas sp.]|nr:entericidin, EcnA/B family [Silicimonas sp.]